MASKEYLYVYICLLPEKKIPLRDGEEREKKIIEKGENGEAVFAAPKLFRF